MKMKIAVAAVAAAFASPAALAQLKPVPGFEWSVYGRVFLTAEAVKADGGTTPMSSRTRISDNSSLLGVRAEKALTGSLKGWGQLETGFKADDTTEHHMHHEIGHIDGATAAALNAAKGRGNKVISVGTTSLRLLESAVDENGRLAAWSGSTDIFITPGYRFKIVDRLMTNFHLPRSTLFMLVSAFSGLDTMRSAYDHAIQSGYRFYSYGDASLLTRKD